MLTNYVILKFMQYWSAKGDVAFKLGNSFSYMLRSFDHFIEQKARICLNTTVLFFKY